MATGNLTYMGLAVPLYGEAQITGVTAANDVLTITGVSAQTGDYLVLEDSSGNEDFVIGSTGMIGTMVLGTVALASLASNASATVALTGITTDHIVQIFNRVAATNHTIPSVWASAADKLGYASHSAVTTAAQTVNVWYFKTA